jgi:energy-coupling factor transporter ATPase
VSERIIEVSDLHHAYLAGTPYRTPTLRGVSLHLCRGETVGLVGPSGSGKSTLLQHLNGLLKPLSGRVILQGAPLGDGRGEMRRVRRRVGLVLQSPESALFERFVGDDVAFGPRNLGLGREEVRERVRRALAMVGLDFSFKDRETRAISGGEKRRVAIAGVLAMEPEVLLLDEPTANMDPAGRRMLRAALRRWREEDGRSLIIVSQDMEEILEMCDRVYLLAGGRVVGEGPLPEFFTTEGGLLEKFGLEVPFVTGVMSRIGRLATGVNRHVRNLEEAADAVGALIHEG